MVRGQHYLAHQQQRQNLNLRTRTQQQPPAAEEGIIGRRSTSTTSTTTTTTVNSGNSNSSNIHSSATSDNAEDGRLIMKAAKRLRGDYQGLLPSHHQQDIGGGGNISAMAGLANAANTSYGVLLVVSVLIIILNVSSMSQLGEYTTFANTAQQSLKLFQQKSSPPTYFADVVRMFMPIQDRPAELPRKDLVKPGDSIYWQAEGEDVFPEFDRSPIVVEDYKLIFFTIPKVGCTVWKQLFRRMMGYDNWKDQNEELGLPHDPRTNGLKYLHNYSLERASEIMSDPSWTRALMVRDPKMRFLSAFLDKAMRNDHKHIIDRCCPDKSCVDAAIATLEGFLDLCHRCDDGHWESQHRRVENKYWPYIDHVGHVETAAVDARRLLEKIGAWDKYGASGWGPHGNQSIFESKEGLGGAGEHANWAEWQVWTWYTPQTEAKVESFYQSDYENPLFNFTRGVCLTCT